MTRADKNKIKLEERLKMEKKMLKEHKEERAREEGKRKRNNEKLYLGEIIERENPEFGTNTLILAPTGSGKSHLIESTLIPKYIEAGDLVYYLVSTTSLKDAVCPHYSEERKALAYPTEEYNNEGNLKTPSSLGFFTTGNRESFGDVSYRVHVMTYAEFGGKIQFSNKEVKKAPLIICDEIHSAPYYRDINNDMKLTHAVKYLFDEQEDQIIFYFTATNEHLEKLERNAPGQMRNVTTIDYREHKKIRKYVWEYRYVFNHLEQIRVHLKAGLKGTNYYGYKTLAFTSQIRQMEDMERIFIEEGYKPLLLWSVNSDREMTAHQVEMRKTLLSTELIPEPYNVLIINGGMQEGWDLHDDKVRMAVINSTIETEVIQAVGRIRGDITTLVQKTKEQVGHKNVIFPDEFLNSPLSTQLKSDLCEKLDLKDENGRQLKWTSIKRIAEEKGYRVVDNQIKVRGKRTRVSTIESKY